ncbi:MAG: hypothetical protein ACE5F7_00030 [Nitrospiria bacterium]
MMKLKNTILGLMTLGILFSAGMVEAQTTTSFNDGTCASQAACGLAGGTNRLFEAIGDNVFFQEQVTIGGQLLNHMIIRSKPDGSTGSEFIQETFTPGGAVTGATTTTSTNNITFKQSLKAATDGGTATTPPVPSVDILVRMDNLNIINKGTGPGQEDMVGTNINITQSITDPGQGLTRNDLTLTPDGTGGFNTHIDQLVTDPTTPGFSSSIVFDTGLPATVDQSF